MARRKVPLGKVFGMPALLGVLSLIGLVSALVGDGPFDLLSWLGLLAPVAAIAWALTLRKA